MTLDAIKSLLTSGLDTAHETPSFRHEGVDVVVHFGRSKNDRAITVDVFQDCVRIGSTGCGGSDFLALADAYARAAAFIRATGLPIQ